MPSTNIPGAKYVPKQKTVENPFKDGAADLSKIKQFNWKDVEPLGQHVIVEPIPDVSAYIREKMTASGLIVPDLVQQGQIQDQGLALGTVIKSCDDQNLLIDKTRPVNSRKIVVGDLVWYSSYSATRMIDWREGKQGELLDLVPLEDLQAVITQK